MKPNRRNFFLLSTLAAVFAAQSAHAVDFYWDGATGNWGTVGDWSTTAAGTTNPAAVPNSTTTADLFFNITSANALSSDISNGNAARNAASLTFNTTGNIGIRAGGANTAASTLTIGAGGITKNANSGTVTVGTTPTSFGTVTTALGAAQSWTNNGTGSLTVVGPVTNSTFLLTVAGTGNTSIQGIIGAGSGGITKNGTGALTLSGTNTYTGTTTLNSGTLNLNNTRAVGGQLTINGGKIDTTNATAGLSVLNNAQVWGGNFEFVGTSNFNLGTGTVNLNAGTRTVTTTANTLTVGGIISNGALTKDGAGTLRLNGANTYTGATTVNNGKLQIGSYTGVNSSSSITVAGGGTSALEFAQVGTGTTTNTINKAVSLHGTMAIIGGSSTNRLNLTWDGDITLAGNSTITNNGNSLWDINGQIDLGAHTLTYQADGTNSRIDGSIIGASGSLVKTSAQDLTLTGNNTYGGSTSINAGTLIVSADNNLGTAPVSATAGSLIINGGTLSVTAGFALNANRGMALGPNTGSGSGAISVAANQALTYGGTIANNGAGTGSLNKAGSGTFALSGTNTYTGTTTVTAGTLQFANQVSLYNNNNADWTAANLNVKSGATLAFNVGGTGEFTAGDVTTLLTNLAASSGATDGMNAGSNFGFDTTNAGGSFTIADVIADSTGLGGGARGLVKLGTGTLLLNNTNTYTGATLISQGTLAMAVDHNLAGNLTLGSATGTGSLDLSTANVNATFGSLNAVSNSSTANTIAIGSGKKLQINGAVSVGTTSGNTTTGLTATGLGTLSIGDSTTPTNAGVSIGVGEGSGTRNNSTLDLSGLSNFYANLGTGTFRVGSPTNGTGGGSGTTGSTAILAGTSTIQAAAITVGSQDSVLQSLRLGSGTNTLNADTITVGTSGRASANVSFHGATGSVTVRSSTGGTSRANLTMASTSFGTGTSIAATFDTTDHNADLMFGTITLAQRSGTSASGTGNATATLNFNQGTLNANDLIAGSVTLGASTGSATGSLNLSGGTATFNSLTNPLRLGVNADESRTAAGNLNISGTANVTVAAFGGTSIQLGNATVAGGTATGALSITGGSLTVAGDIIRGDATGTSNATLALNGASATLDMGGNDITSLTGITYTDGTLKNLGTVNTGMTLAGTGSRVFDQGTGVNGEIQGAMTGTGIGLTKQGTGKLTLSGTNTYDGATLVSAGTLFVTGSLTSNVTVSDTATVGGGGTVGDISFGGGSFLDIALAVGGTPDSLTTGAISFAAAGFGVDNLVFNGAAVDWSTVANGTYTLLTGTLNSLNLDNFGLANAFNLGGGRSAYFQSGSLQLVVIPEPSVAALIGALGGIMLLRRRR